MSLRALAIVPTLLLAGCYRQVPIESSRPSVGTRAKVVLSDAGAVDMARLVGPNTTAIEGDAVTGSGDAITLAVRRIVRRNGVEEFWKGENVTIPRTAVAMSSERGLSRSRTVTFGAGVIVAALSLGHTFGDVSGLFRGGGRGGTGSEK
jgi:hypothetical protein